MDIFSCAFGFMEFIFGILGGSLGCSLGGSLGGSLGCCCI